MGLLSFFTNLIAPQKTSKPETTSATRSVDSVKKSSVQEPVKMVSDEAMASEKNEDTVRINRTTREQLYRQIEELCADYRMSMEDVKQVGLLEKIAGCSTEELLKKSNDEISKYMEALKHTLKFLSWKWPWQNRTVDDIEKIAKQSNDRIVYQATSKRSWLGELFRSKKTLAQELDKNGYELNEQGLKSYMKKAYSDLIDSGKPPEEAYAKLYERFGNLLIDTQDPHQREILTGAIAELRVTDRRKASELSIRSCACDSKCEQAVARGLSDNYEEISCSKDALGDYTTEDDNIGISCLSFSHLNNEDASNVLAKMKSRRAELTAKSCNGEVLTEEEQRYLDTAQTNQYSGAVTGCSYNVNLNQSQKNTVLQTIDQDTEAFGIRDSVYKSAAAYVAKHQESLPIDSKTFTSVVDKATGNNYSRVLSNTENTSSTVASQNSSINKSEKDAAKTQKTTSSGDNDSNESSVKGVTGENSKSISGVATSTNPWISGNAKVGSTSFLNYAQSTSQGRSADTDNSAIAKNNKVPQNLNDKKAEVSNIAECVTNESCKSYIKQKGALPYIMEALSNSDVSQFGQDFAINLYNGLNGGTQELVLKTANTNGVIALLKEGDTKDSVLKNLADVKLASYSATNAKDNELKKMEKENSINFA